MGPPGVRFAHPGACEWAGDYNAGMARDLNNPKWMYVKAALFVVIGVTASAVLLIDAWSWKHAALLAVAVWAFCRAYYFAFYVIERYIDPDYKFAGLIDFVRYLLRR